MFPHFCAREKGNNLFSLGRAQRRTALVGLKIQRHICAALLVSTTQSLRNSSTSLPGAVFDSTIEYLHTRAVTRFLQQGELTSRQASLHTGLTSCLCAPVTVDELSHAILQSSQTM